MTAIRARTFASTSTAFLTNGVANRILIPLLRSASGARLGRRLAVVEYRGRRTPLGRRTGARGQPVPARQSTDQASVDLYWLPLGAGGSGGLVRGSGRLYEALTAALHRRTALHLYHSALIVGLDGAAFTIEMAPVWAVPDLERGVVSEGPVGTPLLGRARLFRYEVRCWRGGAIPDVDAAVESPRRLSSDPLRARQLIDLVAQFPLATWGRDEQQAGEMWNSNSLTAWLLTRSGHDMAAAAARPPDGGRAPGWSAGLVVAARTEVPPDDRQASEQVSSGLPSPLVSSGVSPRSH